ncbi:MAG TPA: undecaprenyl-diphosphatase UppP [Pyrinomonadaceae bacterium]|nr:undecaprenyl-diphosphatase UppP [Pyrinomonadaceae bacterium]
MTILQAIVLGVVQGLTEFIPISSTAHLIFATRLTGLSRALTAEQTTAVIAVIQLGTLLAVFVYFARDIWAITSAFVRDHLALARGRAEGGWWAGLSQEARLGWLVFVGSLPIGVVGLAFKDEIEGTFTKNLWVIAAMMIVVALLLAAAEKVGRRRTEMGGLGLKDALAVGFAQVLSLVPGASRSGSTMMGGLFAGQTRETAARFSFLLSIPAITASGLLELNEALEKLPPGSAAPLAVATVVSGVVGYASIWFLLRFLRTHSTGVFIAYRLAVGALILALLAAGAVRALDETTPAAEAHAARLTRSAGR